MGMQEMMRQAQVMQKKIAAMQEELADKTVEASSGGGMVTVKASGSQEIREITIDPGVVDADDLDMLQDLILTATNEALKKAKEMMESEMSKITGGLKIPGIV
jgi:hypothetical protein